MVRTLGIALVLCGCGPAAPPPRAPPAVAFSGSCQWARPAGPVADYRLRLEVLPAPTGVARIRRTPIFDPADDRNVIGAVDSGTVLAAQGPLAESAWSHGVGYAVLLRGHDSRLCRGYVAATAVKETPRPQGSQSAP
jgi:hypothetical protein